MEVATQTKARIYGSKSAKNIALGGDLSEEKVTEIAASQIIEIGKFTITILPGKHAPHIRLLNFISSDDGINEPLKSPTSYNEFCMGENYNFYIQHPDGNILFHPSAEVILREEDKVDFHPDLIIQGIANRLSTQNLIDNVLNHLKQKSYCRFTQITFLDHCIKNLSHQFFRS